MLQRDQRRFQRQRAEGVDRHADRVIVGIDSRNADTGRETPERAAKFEAVRRQSSAGDPRKLGVLGVLGEPGRETARRNPRHRRRNRQHRHRAMPAGRCPPRGAAGTSLPPPPFMPPAPCCPRRPLSVAWKPRAPHAGLIRQTSSVATCAYAASVRCVRIVPEPPVRLDDARRHQRHAHAGGHATDDRLPKVPKLAMRAGRRRHRSASAPAGRGRPAAPERQHLRPVHARPADRRVCGLGDQHQFLDEHRLGVQFRMMLGPATSAQSRR